MKAPTRPLVRYHGGKWRVAPWIIRHLPPHVGYVEPFGGAASVLLQKPRSAAEVWNDLDGEIFNLFDVVRERSAVLTRAALWTPFARAEYERSFEPSDDPLERARRYLVRSFMGYSARGWTQTPRQGFRINRPGGKATCALDWARHAPSLRDIARRFRAVVLEQRPALDVIAGYDREDTLFYVDPPYVVGARKSRSVRYRHDLNDDDHAELLDRLRGVRGMVALSGYPSELYSEALADWRLVRTVSHDSSSDRRAECLWLNPSAASALEAPLFAGGAS